MSRHGYRRGMSVLKLESKNMSHATSIKSAPASRRSSGAGKSSFLRLLNRLDEATGGTVLLDGEDYRAIAPRELRRRVGMVMQMAYLFPGTVGANIAFGPLQRHETMSQEQIKALLDRVALPGYQDRDVSTLSGGEA